MGQHELGWYDGQRCNGSQESRCNGWKHNVGRCDKLRSNGLGDGLRQCKGNGRCNGWRSEGSRRCDGNRRGDGLVNKPT